MAFCAKCGVQVEDDQKFCPACGTEIGAPGVAPAEPPAQTDVVTPVQTVTNTPDTTAAYDPADIEKNKVLALLAYLGILWLVPMLAAKDSAYAKFHTNQGLVLWLVGIIGAVLNVIPILGSIASGIVGIITFVLAILGIVNAVQGNAKELPIIGKFRILK